MFHCCGKATELQTTHLSVCRPQGRRAFNARSFFYGTPGGDFPPSAVDSTSFSLKSALATNSRSINETLLAEVDAEMAANATPSTEVASGATQHNSWRYCFISRKRHPERHIAHGTSYKCISW